MSKAKSQKSLDSWTKEDWGIKSGKNSTSEKSGQCSTRKAQMFAKAYKIKDGGYKN